MTDRFDRRHRATVLLFLLLFICAPHARGQTATGTLEGRVADAAGALLADAEVKTRGRTGERTVRTDAHGSYRVPVLPPGAYSVTASSPGFTPRAVEVVTLAIDRTTRLDLVLEVAGGSASVTVEAARPTLDPTTSATVRALDGHEVTSLPLNGRNYLDLVRLAASASSSDRSPVSNLDSRGSLLGERAGNIAYVVNGLANVDELRGGPLAPLTLDAVQELEVIQAGYKAEFGRGSGGVVNVLTRSGTDEHRASGFLFARNEALDASSVPGKPPPDLRRWDYGLTLGGPGVSRARSWYFVTLDHVRETREAIFPADVPGLLAAGEDFSRRPATDAYRTFATYEHRLGPGESLRADLGYAHERLSNRLSSAIALPSASLDSVTRTAIGSVHLTSLLGASAVLESTLGLRAQDFDQNRRARGGRSYEVIFLDGAQFDVGPPAGGSQSLDQRSVTLREVLSLFPDRHHAAKLGVEVTRMSADGSNGQGVLNVVVTSQALFEQYGLESFQIPQGTAFLRPGDERTRLRNTGLGLFAQDDWRVHDRLTLNLGLRHDHDSKLGERGNLSPRLGAAWMAGARTKVTASLGWFYDRYRLGIAQAVPALGGFDGRTVVEFAYPRLAADAVLPLEGSLGAVATAVGDPFFIHDAFGIAHDAVVDATNVEALTGLPAADFLERLERMLDGLGVPFAPIDFSPTTGYLRQDLSAALQDEVRVARPFRTPHNRTVTVGVEQEIVPGLKAAATFVDRRILDILGLRITNLAPEARALGSPATSDGGPLQRTYGPWYDGRYRALLLTLDGRLGSRLEAHASYTYSRASDNLLNSNLLLGLGMQGGGSVPTDSLDLEADRGNSDLAVPHRFVASLLVELPRAVAVSGVFQAESGFHFSATGALVDHDGDGILSTRPPATRRNQFRGPAAHEIDLRVEKRFQSRHYTASVLADLFNLTNARNPRLVDDSFVDEEPGPGFGRIRVPRPGREIQVGLRLGF